MEHGRITVLDGKVQELLSDGRAKVELSDGRCIIAEVSAKIKVRLVRIQLGDAVRCELSPVDPSKARIIASL
jgi:translation initiation factor IF-1